MASRYWIGGGTNSNWNASPTTNWSATSGGAVRVAAPTIADDVFFDGAGASGNSASIISATISCLSLTISAGYTNTITHNAVLTISSNWAMHSGFTIAGSSSITLSSTTACLLTSGGKTWPNALTLSNNKTITLSGNFTVNGLVTLSNIITLTPTTTDKLYFAGGLTLNGELKGTVVVDFTGGTLTSSNIAGYSMTVNYRFAGNVTIAGVIRHQQNNTITYISGTINSGSSTLLFISNTTTTFDTDGITWNIIESGNTNIFSLSSQLTANTILSSTSLTFTGVAGFTVGTFSETNISAATVTLKESINYTITSSLSAFSSRNGSSLIFVSSHASTKANLILQNGASCACLANFTRIDSSGGRPIRSFNGTITDCINIQSFNDLATVASAA